MAKAVIDGLTQSWEDYKKLFGDASNGDKEPMGGVMFEAALFLILGFEELIGLKTSIKVFNGVSTKVFSKTVANSAGTLVERQFVRTEDELLRIADHAAGGSLDNFIEIKPNFFA